MASSASYCDCYLTDTWSAWSWRWLSIAVSPLQPATANGALRRLKNGVTQGSVLAPLLFNIYIPDLPNIVSRKYAYADDLEIMHADGDWQALEGVLRKGMTTVSGFLQTRKVKLSTTKTVSVAFHFNNKEAKRELKVNHDNEILPFWSEPKYLGANEWIA